ncbi:MAG: NUDIX domain-containing protein [Bacteroidia bacterium]|nr:NUDIX domain-containing protein [Bacteroidia bacterium]
MQVVETHTPRPLPTVGGLIFNPEGKILLVRTHKWADLLGTPGGKMEYGETMEEAFIREAKEETGLDIYDLKFVLIRDAINHPQFYRPNHFILINFTAQTYSSEVILNDEAYEYQWVGLEESLLLDLNQPTRVLIETVMNL